MAANNMPQLIRETWVAILERLEFNGLTSSGQEKQHRRRPGLR